MPRERHPREREMSHSATIASELADLLKPPTDAEAEAALARFTSAAQRLYGDRLRGIYLFGSRARADHRPDSDADVAVVLADGDWISWQERWTLARLAYEPSIDSGLAIQPWPFSLSKWNLRSTALVKSARQDAVPIWTPQ